MTLRRGVRLLVLFCLATLLHAITLTNGRFSTNFVSTGNRWIAYELSIQESLQRFEIVVVSQVSTYIDELRLYLQYGSPIDTNNPPLATNGSTYVAFQATEAASVDCAAAATTCAKYAISVSPCEAGVGSWYAAVYYAGQSVHTYKLRYRETSGTLSQNSEQVGLEEHDYELRHWYAPPSGFLLHAPD